MLSDNNLFCKHLIACGHLSCEPSILLGLVDELQLGIAMPFNQQVHIEDNARLRIPQREGWIAIRGHFAGASANRQVGIVLPVGCGKSGLIAIAPYGRRKARFGDSPRHDKFEASWERIFAPTVRRTSTSAFAF